MWVSADTLTAFPIAIIQDTHNAVYDEMRTYHQMAHNQATIEMPQRVQQLMNSHYNIALLADYKQVINALPTSKSKSASDTFGTNANQTKFKSPIITKVQIPATPALDTT